MLGLLVMLLLSILLSLFSHQDIPFPSHYYGIIIGAEERKTQDGIQMFHCRCKGRIYWIHAQIHGEILLYRTFQVCIFTFD